MIIHLKENIDRTKIEELALKSESILLESCNSSRLITPFKTQALPAYLEGYTDAFFPMSSDIQLASKDYNADVKEIDLGTFKIGGNSNNTVLIGGPCSVESEAQINASAEFLVMTCYKFITIF